MREAGIVISGVNVEQKKRTAAHFGNGPVLL
jgi:hypothetical protein